MSQETETGERDAVSDHSAGSRNVLGRIAQVVAQILQRPCASHTVASLALAAGMSRSGFAQSFNEQYGESPIAFVKRERLRYAANLLRTTSLPMKSVAAQAGYSSRSSFYRAFQREFGKAPNALRAASILQHRSFSARADDRGSRDLRLADKSGSDNHSHPTSGGIDEALLRAHDRLQAVCSATLDVVWDIDLATGRVWWSEGMLKVFGCGPEQVGPDTTWCHQHIHPEDRERVVRSMHAACEGEDVLWQDSFRYQRADGSFVHVDDRGMILRDSDGKAIRFVGGMRVI